MEFFAGLDVSLEQSSVRVVDRDGRIVREAEVPSCLEALPACPASAPMRQSWVVEARRISASS